MRKPKKRIIAMGGVLLLSAGIFVSGLVAYMSDREHGINVMKVGNVDIVASEPNFPTKDSDGNGVPDDCELMIPYKTIPKDPKIKNVGNNDAVVFFKVVAPVESLTLIGDDGQQQAAKLADLFWFKQNGDGDDAHANNFNANWIELTGIDGQVVDCPGVNDEGKGITYIFGYKTRIKPGQTTSTLFDKVQNKKYGSTTIGPNEVENIHIESYAIQADNIMKDGKALNLAGTLSQEDLTYIYTAFVNQNSDRVD